MLDRLALLIVRPGVLIFVPQPPFSVADVGHQVAVLGTTLTAGYGACAGKGESLAAVALKSAMHLMPTVDPAEGDFEGAVVRFDALNYLGHLLLCSCRLTPQTSWLSFRSFDSRSSASVSINCSRAAWTRTRLRPRWRPPCHWDALVPPCGPSRSSLRWPTGHGLENALKGIFECYSGLFCLSPSLTRENIVDHIRYSLVFVHELPFPL